MDKSTLGDRMKEYEKVTSTKVLKRTPLIIRVDGKAFHTFTKQITPENDPSSEDGFSEKMHHVMMETAEFMCNNIQNVCMAYTQSDEISLVLRDWDKHTTQQWFDGKIQKMVSVAASLATYAFNETWDEHFDGREKPGLFDARAFNVPMNEVNNYMIWRQQDATRNSIQFVGRKHFSHKELHKKNASQIQDKLMLEAGINWNDLPIWQRRGACISRFIPDIGNAIFLADEAIPIFTKNSEYVADQLDFGLGDE